MRSDHSNSVHQQRARLLTALRRGAVSTIEARRSLDIISPAARIKELRDAGHTIVTAWTVEETDCGKPHRCAKYVLMGEARFVKTKPNTR